MKSFEIIRIGEVDVWQIDLNKQKFCLAYEQILSEDEKKRAQSFYFSKDRERFVQVRYALRLILGKYLTTSAASIVLHYGSHGKPEVASEPCLGFSVSHSGAKALVAIAWDCAVGIDIEVQRADLDTLALARSCFSTREVKKLQAMGKNERRLAFLRGWTRKEAYAKGLGLGLSLKFDSFDVDLSESSPHLMAVHHHPSEIDRWSLYNVEAGAGYVASLAMLAKKAQK